MSRGVSKGGYELRKSLGSLSVDGCSCVFAHLVAWPPGVLALEPIGCWVGPGLCTKDPSKTSASNESS